MAFQNTYLRIHESLKSIHMKKTITLFTTFFFLAFLLQAQVLIVKWTFPTGAATDSLADGGLAINLDKAIHTEGGTSAIDFSKNGASTKAAQATGWDNGANLKCWVVRLNTSGHDNLKISSKMQSGGNNPGPRDYAVQYRIGAAGTWTDIPGTTITVANDWLTGILDSVNLPAACANQPSLYLRWVMTSNTNSQGSAVAATGIDKIDDIYVTGKQVNTVVRETSSDVAIRVTGNPSTGSFRVEAPEAISSLNVFSLAGKCVWSRASLNAPVVNVSLDSVPRGTYFMTVKTVTGKKGTQKVLVH